MASKKQTLNSLSLQQLTDCVNQIFSNPRFWENNRHILSEQRAMVKRRAIANESWPSLPIFSPYATGPDRCSQVEFRGAKYHVQWVMFRFYHGGRRLDEDLKISYILNCGKHSCLNINSLYLVEESNILNRTRLNCFLHQDLRMNELHLLPPQQWPPKGVRQAAIERVGTEMNQCRALHSHKICTLYWEAWMEDYVTDGIQDLYAGQTETESKTETD